MFIIIGILVVLGAVAGGYLMEHGNLKVLLQPAELLIIGGAALGTVLIANPLHVLKKIVSGSKPYGTDAYTNWELSVDRANAAPRYSASRWIGRASDCVGARLRRSELEEQERPEDPANRRISVIVQYLEGDAPQAAPEKPSSDKPATGEKN